jgi:ubiquinone/menaquinone biosynthesis C-methylase UbiE
VPDTANRETAGYADVWIRGNTLDGLNASIHDGVPESELPARGRGLCQLLLEAVYPDAAPAPGSTVLEVGSGVGWIMQAVLERYQPAHVLGLDVSRVIARCGTDRLRHPRATFLVYDGLRVPLASDALATIYSVSALHHVEKHAAFLIFQELHRVLAPGGHAVLHLLSIQHAPHAGVPFAEECWNHVTGNTRVYWHHYYSLEELVVLFSQLIGVDDLDVRPVFGNDGYLVHFSKGTGRRFRNPELADLVEPGTGGLWSLHAARRELAEIRASTSWRLTAPVRRLMDTLRGRG